MNAYKGACWDAFSRIEPHMAIPGVSRPVARKCGGRSGLFRPINGTTGAAYYGCGAGSRRQTAPQRPLPLELPTFLFQLAHRLERDRNAILGESIEEEALDQSIDRQGPDFLT